MVSMDLFVAERHKLIMNLLRERQRVTVDEIAVALKTSKPTVRRDLAVLEETNMIQRTHGGAIVCDYDPLQVYDISETFKKNIVEKEKIAAQAAALIKEGDIVALGTGSTIALLAEAVKQLKKITVITNSIPVINRLCGNKDITVIGTGGEFDSRIMGFNGTFTTRQIREFRFDKFFFSCQGYTPDNGSTDLYIEEGESKRAFAERSNESILLADSSKYGRRSLTPSIPQRNIDRIITTSLDAADHNGTKVEIVE
jgi:DeoR/GlpR family transcriptional regulator of sugar metabolism